MFTLTSCGKFVNDANFDYACVRLHGNAYCDAGKDDIVQNGNLVQEILKVSDIPPIILLTCIVNTYSRAFSLFIGLDMKIQKFSDLLAKSGDFLPENMTPDFSRPQFPCVFYNFWSLLVKCNETGTLDTAEWNQIAHETGIMWNLGNDIDDTITTYGSLQSIVEAARKVMNSIKPAKEQQVN